MPLSVLELYDGQMPDPGDKLIVHHPDPDSRPDLPASNLVFVFGRDGNSQGGMIFVSPIDHPMGLFCMYDKKDAYALYGANPDDDAPKGMLRATALPMEASIYSFPASYEYGEDISQS